MNETGPSLVIFLGVDQFYVVRFFFVGYIVCVFCAIVCSLKASNCRLQVELVNSMNNETGDDPFALALRSLRFRSASQTHCCSISELDPVHCAFFWIF